MEIDVKKLALLARIKISDDEEEKLQKEFGAILGYVSKLQEVDVSEIDDKEASRTTELQTVMRKDEVTNEPGEYTEALLREAPETERGYIKVKKVLG